jgi:maltose alpha-D-glucosyltransferase/alpha-amylase
VLALGRVRDWPDDKTRLLAEAFLSQAEALAGVARTLAKDAGDDVLQTRVHGDFHLGQILVTQGDATLIDFEGEPAKTMAQRRAKSCAMRDVAGLLRSLDYAAATAASGRTPLSEKAAERRAKLVEKFRVGATRAFLDCYQATLAAAPRPWISEVAFPKLLDLFLLEKAVYEIRYEAANRPAWIGIPLSGVARIAARLLG